MSNREKSLYSVALAFAKGVGPVAYKNLIDYFGVAKNVFDASDEKIQNLGINLPGLHSEKHRLLSVAERFLKMHQEKGIEVVAYGEYSYSTRLAQIHAPPSLLYYSKNVVFNKNRIVSIVGTRRPTAYGKKVTIELIQQLKKYNPIIVSGLAYGIDIIAHETALECDIDTIAVMAGGIDKIYPPLHTSTAKALMKSGGGLVSEYSAGIKPIIHHFPVRNRIIAGLSDVVVVIEAPKRSGALITAYYANEFNREVFAVPSGIYSECSVGCHELIKKNVAHLLTNADDLAYLMDWTSEQAEPALAKTLQNVSLTEEEKAFIGIVQAASSEKVTMEKASVSLNMPAENVISLALELELKGVIEVRGDKYFLVRG